MKLPGRKERHPHYVDNVGEGTLFSIKRNMISYVPHVIKWFYVKILALMSLLVYNFLIEVQGGETTWNHLDGDTEH